MGENGREWPSMGENGQEKILIGDTLEGLSSYADLKRFNNNTPISCHVQSRDRLNMTNETLQALAFLYINKDLFL